MGQQNFVRIATFPNEVEAQLAQATLSAANIESVIHTDDVGHMLPSLEQAEGVDLLVDGALASEAITILTNQSMPAHDDPEDDLNPESSGTA